MSDIEAIRKRHVEATFLGPNREADWQACRECSQSWPCDTRIVLDALDAVQEQGTVLVSEKWAERALADELADALERYKQGDDCYCGHGWGDPMTPEHTAYCRIAAAALAKHKDARGE